MRLEKIKQAKEKIKQSVKDWEKDYKSKDRRRDKEDEGDEDEEDERRQDAMRRIEELEILNEDLPSMEALLVDPEMNKEFFEKKLPMILNHELLDDDKKQECITLIRKYHTLQTHVGYGVK